MKKEIYQMKLVKPNKRKNNYILNENQIYYNNVLFLF